MNVSPILQKVSKPFNTFAEWKPIRNQLKKAQEDPASFAAGMLVTSIVSKDLVGCVLYTSQSLNNQKIPEEKRKFVAALDLMNGIIMVGGQLFIGKVVDAKVTPRLKSLFTGQVVDPNTKAVRDVNTNAILHPDNLKKLVEKAARQNNVKNIDVAAIVEKITKTKTAGFEKGFGILVAAIATTALTKRTIAPLLSTPAAGWLKEHFMDKKPKTQKDRMYYEVAAVEQGKFEHKMDKTAFSQVASRQA